MKSRFLPSFLYLVSTLPAFATVTLDTITVQCSAATSPCSAVDNANMQKILLANPQSLHPGCTWNFSDTMISVFGQGCSSAFTAYVLWDYHLYESDYTVKTVNISIPADPFSTGGWVAVPDAVPNSRKVHGVTADSIVGDCTWSFDSKKITVLKEGGNDHGCTASFRALSGPAY